MSTTDIKEQLMREFDVFVTSNEVLRDVLGKWAREEVRGFLSQSLTTMQEAVEREKYDLRYCPKCNSMVNSLKK